MGKLSASKYLKNNKKRAVILIISFGLYFALLYGIRFLINPMFYTDEAVYLGNADKMQNTYVNQAGKLSIDLSLWEEDSKATEEDLINELNRGIGEFKKELEKDKRVDHVIQCFTYNIPIHTLTGSTMYYVPLVSKEETKLICNYLGVTLIEGNYPIEPGDIIMDRRMANNRNLQLGESVYDSNTRLCGIVSSDSYFATGIEFGQLNIKRNLLFLDQGTIPDLTEFFDEYGWEASIKSHSSLQIVTDIQNNKKAVDKFKKETDQPLMVMTYVITLIMGVTLYFVYQLHIRDRYEEWCLYRSLGYSRHDVFTLAIKEYLICILLSIGIALFCLAFIFGLGGSMMKEKGIVYYYWIPETLFQLTAVVIFLSGVLQIPVYIAMRRITTIDAIEDDI